MAARMKALIAYDGSACAEAALDDLKRAGLPGEVEATVVTVAELWLPPPSATFKPVLATATEPLTAPVEAARTLAIEASRRLQTIFPAWDVRAEALVGSPASAILNKADEWKPDMIVAGSHGRSALGRFILGSVSQKIVTEAHCSVRVARGRGIDAGAPARILLGFDGSLDARAAVRTIASRAWPEKSAIRTGVRLPFLARQVPSGLRTAGPPNSGRDLAQRGAGQRLCAIRGLGAHAAPSRIRRRSSASAPRGRRRADVHIGHNRNSQSRAALTSSLTKREDAF